MSSYTVPFDILSKRFDSQYPVFLAERGVTHAEYQVTLNQCTEIVGKAVAQLEKRRTVNVIFIILVVIVFGGAMGLCGGLAAQTNFYSLIGIAPAVVFYILALIFFIRYTRNHATTIYTATQQQLVQFLEQENFSKYYSKGVQLLYTSEPMVYSKNALVPFAKVHLNIILSNGPITIANTYQQQPQHTIVNMPPVQPMMVQPQQQPQVYQQQQQQQGYFQPYYAPTVYGQQQQPKQQEQAPLLYTKQ